MPRKRRTTKARAAITGDQKIELVFDGPNFTDAAAFSQELPANLRSRFESPFMRRAAWLRYREDLMVDRGAGRRPGGWWWYEAPERPCEGESQAECLERLGLLEEWETAELTAIERLMEGAKK